MTDATPESIRKGDLPCTPPSEWEFHTWFPHPDGGGDMVRGQRQRGVLVRRRVSYSDWEPVRPDRWADEPETDTRAQAAVPVSVPPAADRSALRDRIADVLADADGWKWAPGFKDHSPTWQGYQTRADAVLTVLPASSDRAAKAEALLLHFTAEAHRRKWSYDRGLDDDGVPLKSEAFDALHRLGDEMNAALHKLRRMAAETPQPETPPCANCGKPVRLITGTLATWWVHDPGGHTICDPQQAATSPRATPAVATQQEGTR